MMEKISPSYQGFQKKITSYLDGSLSPEEVSEFEAFVSTHPEFETLVKSKQDEIDLLKSMIPATEISAESLESLQHEMKTSVYNLLKEEPKNFWDGLKIKYDEWLNR